MSSPDWVYLKTYFEDDFEKTSLVPGAADVWYENAILASNGYNEGVALSQSGSQESYVFFGQNFALLGDFVLEGGMLLPQSGWDIGPSAYSSISVRNGTTYVLRVEWSHDNSWLILDSDTPSYTYHFVDLPYGPSVSFAYKMKRISNVLSVEYNIGAGWVVSNVNGVFSGIIDNLLVKLEQGGPGLSYVRFQADSGFPNAYTPPLPRHYSALKKMFPQGV